MGFLGFAFGVGADGAGVVDFAGSVDVVGFFLGGGGVGGGDKELEEEETGEEEGEPARGGWCWAVHAGEDALGWS